MKILYLTSVGEALAANPTNNTSDSQRTLSWLRRHNRVGTDEQIKDQLGFDGMQMRLVMNHLLQNNAIVVKGGQ